MNNEKKKLLLASGLFVVAIALIGWYLFFGGVDTSKPVSEGTGQFTQEEIAAGRKNARLAPANEGRR